MGDLLADEPRLKYSPLSDEARFPGSVLRLVVSDKVLALGTSTGAVLMLDYNGNHVKAFKEHIAPITDLSFDATADFLASASRDGDVVIYGLYTGEIRKHSVGKPITTVALDPRYSERKSRDFIYGTEEGVLSHISKGWLGSSEAVLFRGRGPIHVARMSGTLLAWVTNTGLRVYDTATNRRLAKVPAPGGFSYDLDGPASLFWLKNWELFVGWGHRIQVLETVRPAASSIDAVPAENTHERAGLPMATTVCLDVAFRVRGVAPFGVTLAVLGTSVEMSEGIKHQESEENHNGAKEEAVTTSGSEASSERNGVEAEPIQMQAMPTADKGENIAEDDLKAENTADEDDGALRDKESDRGNLTADAVETERGADPASTSAVSEENVVSDPQQDKELRDDLGLDPPSLYCFYIIERDGTILSSDKLEGVGPDASLAVFYTESALAASWREEGAAVLAKDEAVAGEERGKESEVFLSRGVRDDVVSNGENPADNGGTVNDRPSSSPEPDSHLPSSASTSSSLDGAQLAAQLVPAESARPRRSYAQPYKWWKEGDEPLYFLVWSQGILVGRPRDGNDRVRWLLEHEACEQALLVALTDAAVRTQAREAAGDAFLAQLVERREFERAARSASALLGRRASAWERLAFTFAWARELRVLAPHLPTSNPRLQRKTYDMVLEALLRGKREDHELLLRLVRRWPPEMYNIVKLLRSVSATIDQASSGIIDAPLLRLAAELCTRQGQYAVAMVLLLRLHDKEVLQYIKEHSLEASAAERIPDLFALDTERTIQLGIDQTQVLTPSSVVMQLVTAAERANNDADERLRWRQRLFAYLEALHQREPMLSTEFALLQVELTAELAPQRLMAFLLSSSAYPLEATLRVCERHGLVHERVYVLGRMGATDRALQAIILELRDVPMAVRFVQEQRDDGLWPQLLDLALGNNDTRLAGELLDAVDGSIDPLSIVQRIPKGLHIERLGERIRNVVRESRGNVALQAGCANILRADEEALATKLHAALRCALPRVYLRSKNVCGRDESQADKTSQQRRSIDTAQDARGFNHVYQQCLHWSSLNGSRN